MELYLLRHGLAGELSETIRRDADRVLTREGVAKTRLVARGIDRLKLRFDRILSSPYVRARQTAEIVSQLVAKAPPVEVCEHLTPLGRMPQLITALNQLDPEPGSLLLVGHEPMLSGLAALIVFGDPAARITMKKAGLCKLTVGTPRFGRCGTLEWLLTPKQLGLLA